MSPSVAEKGNKGGKIYYILNWLFPLMLLYFHFTLNDTLKKML
jgi:hypothetical protein